MFFSFERFLLLFGLLLAGREYPLLIASDTLVGVQAFEHKFCC